MRVPLSPALLILLTLSLHAASQPGSGSTATPPELPLEFNLQEAVSLALAHSPRLKRSEEMVIQQDHRIREIKATRRPHLNASGGYTQYDEDRLQSFGDFGDVDDARWDANLEASITVFSGGRQRNAVQGELSRYAASESSFKSSREDLLASIHKTYYDAELAQQTIAVREEAIAVLSEQLAFSGNRLKADVGERFDVLQAEVALSSARPPLIRAQNDYRRHLDRLRRLLGMQYPAGKDANDIRLRAAPEPTTPALDIEAAAQRAVAQRAELAQLDALIRAAHYDLKVLRLEQAPTVDLFAGYGIENDQFGGDNIEGWTGGLRMNWDLWNGGLTGSRSRQTLSRIRQLEHEKREIELQVSGEVRSAFYAYEEAVSILKSTTESFAQAEEALRLARNRFEAGNGTQLDILESQYQLTRSKLESSRARNTLQRALVEIKRATGILL